MKRYVIPTLAIGIAMASTISSANESTDANTSEYTLTADQKRMIAAILTAPKSAPGIGLGVPTGFGASQGQAFFSIGGTSIEDVNGDNDYDGSASVGVGFGDPSEHVGVELQANIISLTNNSDDSGFGEQGSTSIKFSRNLNSDTGFAFGIENLSTWGSGLDNTDPSVYVAFTNVSTLSDNPFNPYPLSLTIGMGNERFRGLSNGERDNSIGIFGAVALAVHRQVGLVLDYNGNYFNAGASFVPMKQYPLTATLNLVNIDSVDANDGGTASGDPEFGASIGYSWSY